jgi:hypothetical protein
MILLTIPLTTGVTTITVGKATMNENPKEGSHWENESDEMPRWWKVAIADTIPDMSIDRKKLNRYGEAGCGLRASAATGVPLVS